MVDNKLFRITTNSKSDLDIEEDNMTVEVGKPPPISIDFVANITPFTQMLNAIAKDSYEIKQCTTVPGNIPAKRYSRTWK